jgi:hypothetical protein
MNREFIESEEHPLVILNPFQLLRMRGSLATGTILAEVYLTTMFVYR